MDVKIHCPVHGKDETLVLKDGYWYFTHVVSNGNSDISSEFPDPRVAKIDIENGTSMSVESSAIESAA